MITYEPLREQMKLKNVSFNRLVTEGLIASTVAIALKNDKAIRMTSLEKVALYLGLTVKDCCYFKKDE